MVLARAVTSYQNHSGLSLSAAAAFFLVVSKNKDSVDSVDVKTVSGIQGHCHVACSNLRSTQLSALAEHFVAWVASHLELAPGFALFQLWFIFYWCALLMFWILRGGRVRLAPNFQSSVTWANKPPQLTPLTRPPSSKLFCRCVCDETEWGACTHLPNQSSTCRPAQSEQISLDNIRYLYDSMVSPAGTVPKESAYVLRCVASLSKLMHLGKAVWCHVA